MADQASFARIVVIHEDSTLRATLLNVLTTARFAAYSFENFQEAIDTVVRLPPDLLITEAPLHRDLFMAECRDHERSQTMRPPHPSDNRPSISGERECPRYYPNQWESPRPRDSTASRRCGTCALRGSAPLSRTRRARIDSKDEPFRNRAGRLERANVIKPA